MIGFWFILLIISLFVLVKSADFFIDASKKLGLILGISPFFIGVTIVALGTSLPELATSIIAMLNQSSEIVVSNVIGSNITNILLVIGMTAIVAKKIKIDRDILRLDLPILAISTVVLAMMVSWDGVVNIFEGIIALILYIIYLIYLYKSRHDTVGEEIAKKIEETKEKLTAKKMDWRLIMIIFFSCLFLFLGAKYTVESVLSLSALLGITTSAITLSLVALGTSLPELAVTVRAASNGNGDLAIGNVFGSNLFNGSVVIGVATFFGPLQATPDVIFVAVPFLLGATFLYIFSGISHRLYNYEGAMFILIYIMFIAKLFVLF